MSIESQPEALTYHYISLKDGKTPFQAEIYGPENPAKAVIFVDGPDASRESGELARIIEDNLPGDSLSIRGDLSGVSAKNENVLPLKKQAKRLSTMMKYAESRFDIPRKIFIGKSLGALTVALSRPDKSEVLLINPPMDSTIRSLFSEDHDLDQESSEAFNQDLELELASMTAFQADDSFWEEIKSLNINAVYEQLARRNEVNMIFSGSGIAPSSHPVLERVRWAILTNADRDFTDIHRQGFLDLIQNYCKLDIKQHRKADLENRSLISDVFYKGI